MPCIHVWALLSRAVMKGDQDSTVGVTEQYDLSFSIAYTWLNSFNNLWYGNWWIMFPISYSRWTIEAFGMHGQCPGKFMTIYMCRDDSGRRLTFEVGGKLEVIKESGHLW